jgi:hypothetical protein
MIKSTNMAPVQEIYYTRKSSSLHLVYFANIGPNDVNEYL